VPGCTASPPICASIRSPVSLDGPCHQTRIHRAIPLTYEPLETLSYVAARTERIKLGTSVIDAPFHVPVVLARRFATLDRLSGGRVIAGLGQGWMEQEFITANVSPKRRGAGVEEFILAMRAAWGPNPVSFNRQELRQKEHGTDQRGLE
jgi:alkanesulfonate monooxygenase SsuD/methylene tetrahydromethanopterin reductase-like flavin-dependent oxidoreductase (luciferase family)